jgi:hypothetical protein
MMGKVLYSSNSNYDIPSSKYFKFRMASSSMMLIPNFMKIVHLIETLIEDVGTAALAYS